jgi:putative oxidoreductase
MFSQSFSTTWSPRWLGVLRIIAGLMFMEHGLSKYFAFPTPSPATFHVLGLLGLAGALEIVCGGLVAIGLFARVAAFIASGEMAVAYFMSHAPRAFFPLANGGELAILYCFVFLYIALEGGGPWSVDAMRKRA